MKIDISNDVYEVIGNVVKADGQRYTSTTVSPMTSNTTVTNGVAHTSHRPATSTTHYHHNQKIWLIDSDGKESSYDFYNVHIDAREGHEIRLVMSKNSKQIQRYINNSTQQTLRIHGYNPPKNMAARMVAGVAHHIYAFFYALFLSLPLVNIVAAIGMMISSKKKNQFVYPHTLTYFYRFSFFIVVLLILAGVVFYFDSSKRHLAPDLSFTVTAEFQAASRKGAARILLPYLEMGDPLGLFPDQQGAADAEKNITDLLSQSDEEQIRDQRIRHQKVLLFDPNSEISYLTALSFLSAIGFFLLYGYKRKLQKIEYQINRQLDSVV
jgi:hypothetical protein